jgi:hypothetical protein
MLVRNFFEPVVFPLLRDRKVALTVFCAAALLLGMFAIGIPVWPCPFFHAVGIPCPGCGLTRATFLLLHGDVRASLTYHAFAPIFLVGFSVVGAAGLLPERARLPLIEKLVDLEQRTGLGFILLVALILYWLARLLFLNSSFIQLIRG